MALAATTVVEINTGGNDANGGGYNSARSGAVLDMTYPTSAPVTITATLNCSSSTTLTDSGNNFLATMVGNLIQIAGSWFEITAFGSTGSVTITPAGGAITNGTGTVGGALLTPGTAGALAAAIGAGNTVYQKAGTYAITSASTNVAGGCVLMTAGTAGACSRWIGYGTTRGDSGTNPLLQASGIASCQIFNTFNVNSLHVENITVDGALLTAMIGFLVSRAGVTFLRCGALNCKNGGFNCANALPVLTYCWATGCTTQPAIQGFTCHGCVAYSNSITGFSSPSTPSVWNNCISVNNSGASSDGFGLASASNPAYANNCTAYGNGRHGFLMPTAAGVQAIYTNCLAVNHTAVGALGFASAAGTPDCVWIYNCAGFNNTLNKPAAWAAGNAPGFVTLTVNPFQNAAGGDFSLNNTTGGGAACRAAGLPGAFPGVSTTGRQDIGAVQHADAAARQPRYRLGTGS